MVILIKMTLYSLYIITCGISDSRIPKRTESSEVMEWRPPNLDKEKAVINAAKIKPKNKRIYALLCAKLQ
jgi:hypothetical protein